MAHKKGQSSSRNGRDSNPKYRGVKAYGSKLSVVTSSYASAEQITRKKCRPRARFHALRTLRWRRQIRQVQAQLREHRPLT